MFSKLTKLYLWQNLPRKLIVNQFAINDLKYKVDVISGTATDSILWRYVDDYD